MVKSQLPSIDTLAVQCATCFQWRTLPSMRKYEEIREQIAEKPFFCDLACEWEPGMSCEVPSTLIQEENETILLAIDKPGISRTPIGWERLLQFRGEGATRFADVYYIAPTGKKLRSSVEVQKYLNDHPEEVREGVNLSQFSFQIPNPLQKDYVTKRPARRMKSETPVAIQANPTEPGLVDSHDPPSKRTRTSEAEPSTSGSNDDLARQD